MLFLYLFIACSYFCLLLFLIVRDKESSLQNPFHLTVAIVASILWIIIIPISLWELTLKFFKNIRSRNINDSKNSKKVFNKDFEGKKITCVLMSETKKYCDTSLKDANNFNRF